MCGIPQQHTSCRHHNCCNHDAGLPSARFAKWSEVILDSSRDLACPLSRIRNRSRQPSAEQALVGDLPNRLAGSRSDFDCDNSDYHSPNYVHYPMNSQIHYAESGQQDENHQEVSVSVPPTVVVPALHSKPNGEWQADMQAGHSIGERIYSGEPVVDFGSKIVGYCLHLRDMIPSYSYVEEKIEWNR